MPAEWFYNTVTLLGSPAARGHLPSCSGAQVPIYVSVDSLDQESAHFFLPRAG